MMDRPRHVVLLDGGVHKNKGDELMMYAAKKAVSQLFPDAFVGRSTLSGTSEDRRRVGLAEILCAPRKRLRNLAEYWVLKHYHDPKGSDLILERDISIVLNVSGYSYGDAWGTSNLSQATSRILRWRRQGKRIIMLPQSFGPFQKRETARSCQVMLRNADLVYARDEWSFEQLCQAAGGSMPNMRIAPDYSITVDPLFDESMTPSDPFVCLVPNKQVLQRCEPREQQAYCDFMATVARDCVRRGYAPILLVHAPMADIPVAKEIEKRVGTALPCVVHADPRVLKGVLKAAALVVGSRFHALLSALSQGVPCIGIGWHHKYPALFSQYSCPEFVVSAAGGWGPVRELMDQALGSSTRLALVASLQEASAAHHHRTAEMWREIASILEHDDSFRTIEDTVRVGSDI